MTTLSGWVWKRSEERLTHNFRTSYPLTQPFAGGERGQRRKLFLSRSQSRRRNIGGAFHALHYRVLEVDRDQNRANLA
jgi:hypothetical protein